MTKTRNKIVAALLMLAILAASLVAGITLMSEAKGKTGAEISKSLFRTENGATVKGMSGVPEYMGEEYVGTKDGVKIAFDRENAKATFKGVIDLKELNNDAFVELQVTPKNTTYKEMNYLKIILTDIYDENNFITIKLMSGDVGLTYRQYIYVTAAPNNLGAPQGMVINHWVYTDIGTAACSSFYGKASALAPRSLKLSYLKSDTENTVFVDKSDYPPQAKYPVVNFNDSRLGGKFTSFDGFTTGEVTMSIEAEGILSSEAEILVQSIGGKTVNEICQNVGEAKISINNDGQEHSFDAVKGGYYPIADSIAYNAHTIIDKPTPKVYYGENRKNIVVNNDTFETKLAGDYYISYETMYKGAKYARETKVTAMETYPDDKKIKYTMSDKLVSGAYVGDEIILFDGEGEGGIGKLSSKKKVTLNGEEQTIYKNGRYNCFTPAKEGEYIIEYEISDERGSTFTAETHSVNVSFQTLPTIIEPRMPLVLVKGIPYFFPKAEGGYIDGSGKLATKTEINVDGVDYTNKEFIPTTDFSVNYKIYVETLPTKKVEKRYDIKVVDTEEFNLEKYFVTNNITNVTYDKSGMMFNTNTDNAKVSFIRTVPSNNFKLTFFIANGGFEKLNINLMNVDNIDETIKFTIEKIEPSSGYAKFYINDSYICQIKGDFSGNNIIPFSIKYDDKTNNIYDDSDILIGTLDCYENGKAFEGFTEKIYFDMEMQGVKKKSTIKLQSVANQTFSQSTDQDNTAPLIHFSKPIASASRIE